MGSERERERMGEIGGQVSERSDVGGNGDFYTQSFLRQGERGVFNFFLANIWRDNFCFHFLVFKKYF